MGDLGISIKLKDDKEIDPNKKVYRMKGISWAYTSVPMQKAFQGSWLLSKNELFEGDKQSLIMTFDQCLEETKNAKTIYEYTYKELPR